MKEKRQQREDEQARGFCLPTGGVDVSQLAALGICPPPYSIAPSTPHIVHSNQNSSHNNSSSNNNARLSPVDKDISRDLTSSYSRLPSPIGRGLHLNGFLGNNSFYPGSQPHMVSPLSPHYNSVVSGGFGHPRSPQSGDHVVQDGVYSGPHTQPMNLSLAVPRPVYPSVQYIGHRV